MAAGLYEYGHKYWATFTHCNLSGNSNILCSTANVSSRTRYEVECSSIQHLDYNERFTLQTLWNIIEIIIAVSRFRGFTSTMSVGTHDLLLFVSLTTLIEVFDLKYIYIQAYRIQPNVLMNKNIPYAVSSSFSSHTTLQDPPGGSTFPSLFPFPLLHIIPSQTSPARKCQH